MIYSHKYNKLFAVVWVTGEDWETADTEALGVELDVAVGVIVGDPVVVLITSFDPPTDAASVAIVKPTVVAKDILPA